MLSARIVGEQRLLSGDSGLSSSSAAGQPDGQLRIELALVLAAREWPHGGAASVRESRREEGRLRPALALKAFRLS